MRRLLVISAALLLALLGAGCGSHIEARTSGETEGLYLDIDELRYQVQISRYMNPEDTEDRAYLAGLPESESEPAGDETWFGVFIRVQNETEEPIEPADTFEIVDTQENVYEPVELDPEANPFAYQPVPVEPKSLLPEPDSAAAESTIQGALILFKVKTESLQNRPLEFRFRRGSGTEGVVDLDV